jgi:hypothetical protein
MTSDDDKTSIMKTVADLSLLALEAGLYSDTTAPHRELDRRLDQLQTEDLSILEGVSGLLRNAALNALARRRYNPYLGY